MTYRGVNQPDLPRDQFAVWHGPGGIKTYADRPNRSVRRPYTLCESNVLSNYIRCLLTSNKNSQRHPD